MDIIKETGHEGEIHGCMQILSMHKKKCKYYTRVMIDDTYKIALLSYEEIVNNILPTKFQGKLVGNPYWHLEDGTTIIFDINGKEIYIDTEDFDKIKHITWSSTPTNDDYVVGNIKVENKVYKRYLHQFIMGTEFLDREIQVDHMDLNTLNNRKSNLRICNNTVNNRNKQIHRLPNKDMLGIRCIGNKYRADIKYNGKSIYLGSGNLDQVKLIRKLAEEHIKYNKLTECDIARLREVSGIKRKISEINSNSNNKLGIKNIKFDDKSNRYIVRINFKDGRGTIYCGAKKTLEEAIKLRDTLLNSIGGN